MILLIIKSYLAILLSVGIGSIFIFIIGLYLIFKKSSSAKPANIIRSNEQKPKAIAEPVESQRDLSAIAGEDVIATQLDLARAYIETGRKQLAKTILDSVVEQGNAIQQEEAQQLMTYI